jgi:hypothetical protein
MGLREQILAATTIENVDTLLKEGEAYKYASVRTRNAWFHAANCKRLEFGHMVEVRKQEKKAERQEKESKKTPKQKKHGQK